MSILVKTAEKQLADAIVSAIKKAIEKVLKIKVVELSTDPQLMGALGAAEYARQKGMAKEY